MERNTTADPTSFFARLGLGLRILFNGKLAGQVKQALNTFAAQAVPAPAERVNAPALLLLSALQREGRLLDFLQQDVAGFSDEQVGAAARVVHDGCRKVLQQYFELEPAAKEAEGSEVTVPKGFDPQRFRLTGNIAGQPPFRGTLRHHGWAARNIRMPVQSEALDPRLVAPAEVEIS